jgi:hypothetical protein
MKLTWIVYVRWASGQRDTIRTTNPDQLPARDRCSVEAMLPAPRITVQPALRLRTGRRMKHG